MNDNELLIGQGSYTEEDRQHDQTEIPRQILLELDAYAQTKPEAQYDRAIQHFFTRLDGVVRQHSFGLRIDYQGQTYTHTTSQIARDHLPTLHLRNPQQFLDHCLPIYHTLRDMSHHRPSNMWAYNKTPLHLFNNATPSDFEHPETFLDRQHYMLTHPLLTQLHGTSMHLSLLPSLGKPLVVGQYTPDTILESPYELHCQLGDESTDGLHAVRYGLTAPDTATIFAIQMPDIDHFSFRKLTQEQNRLIAGYSKQTLEAIAAKFNQRSTNLKMLAPHLRRRYDQHRIPEELMSAAPSAIMSLTTAITLLHSQGIRSIELPTYLALRQHHRDARPNKTGGWEFVNNEELDYKMYDHLHTLVQRVAHEVDGVAITSYGEGDHYLRLTLANELHSDRPLLAEIISAAKNFTTRK